MQNPFFASLKLSLLNKFAGYKMWGIPLIKQINLWIVAHVDFIQILKKPKKALVLSSYT